MTGREKFKDSFSIYEAMTSFIPAYREQLTRNTCRQSEFLALAKPAPHSLIPCSRPSDQLISSGFYTTTPGTLCPSAASSCPTAPGHQSTYRQSLYLPHFKMSTKHFQKPNSTNTAVISIHLYWLMMTLGESQFS